MILGLRTAIYPGTTGPQPLWGVADPFGNRLGLIENPLFDKTAVR